ncbi:peptidase dimerization domain-containing protein [Cerasicoccus fimbriatus]|uniref:peptidase dimerization domain-containing protein n=1 Tax=Cerasicoccus fimbriatus TaxID=3014554 RepID=UPI0022B3FED0|nr:peptidase dimerization domain-containing protein [Cerasicoccus sp. TK19100]
MTELLDALPDLRERLAGRRELLLANAVMFSEIPSHTFEEAERARFMMDRLIEAGCQNVSTDELGNAVGIHPGKTGKRNILVSAHLDTPFAKSVDHAVQVNPDSIVGPSIMDNSLGLAAVVTLPTLLEQLGIELNDNLVLLGSTRSMGKGDIEGMRFFLENNQLPMRAGVLCEGATLGRLSYSSLGVIRGTIDCQVKRGATGLAAGGAIPVLNRLMTKMLEIPLPQDPVTQLIMGSIYGGTTYNTTARDAHLLFEIRSEGAGVASEIFEQIEAVVAETSSMTGAMADLKKVGNRKNNSISFNHPLVRGARRILKALEVEDHAAPSTGELSTLLGRDIPSLVIGLTNGEHRHDYNETIEIEPIFAGLAQLITLLQAIDGGYCDVDEA